MTLTMLIECLSGLSAAEIRNGRRQGTRPSQDFYVEWQPVTDGALLSSNSIQAAATNDNATMEWLETIAISEVVLFYTFSNLNFIWCRLRKSCRDRIAQASDRRIMHHRREASIHQCQILKKCDHMGLFKTNFFKTNTGVAYSGELGLIQTSKWSVSPEEKISTIQEVWHCEKSRQFKNR